MLIESSSTAFEFAGIYSHRGCSQSLVTTHGQEACLHPTNVDLAK